MGAALSLLLAGCGDFRPFERRSAQPAEPPVAAIFAPGEDVLRPQPRGAGGIGTGTSAPLRPQGRSAEALDTTSAAERAAARAAPQRSGAALGETLASLGPPTEPGFWLRTGLVDRPRQGRVALADGSGVALELRPSGNAPGSGSQISLAAMRALGVPLTQLVTLQVFAD